MTDKPEKAAESPDYRATLFLRATDFPMKAGLPEPLAMRLEAGR